MPRANRTNRLVSSNYYAEILTEYNRLFQLQGKVNNAKFYRDFIAPRIPKYSIKSWEQFILRFKTEAGLIAAHAAIVVAPGEAVVNEKERTLLGNLKDSATATRIGIQKALNIGADALDTLINHPEQMTAENRADLLFKAMKAQDSRIMATAKVRQDKREEIAFQTVFGENAYQEENE